MAAKIRREREDAADRLIETVPALESLTFEIDDEPRDQSSLPLSYVRHVVLATAPALFDLPCGDNKCEEGGHDFTSTILKGLRRGHTQLRGRSRCRGHKGSEPCTRELAFRLEATYQDDQACA
ncbi:MAG: hypothetical protein R3B72_18965 [Polyangiaceae bacterium]